MIKTSAYPSANFFISSIHLTIALALFFPKLIQCQLMSGEGLSTTGIRRTGLPLNSVISGFAGVFSSLVMSESSFLSFSGPTPQLFYAGPVISHPLVGLVPASFPRHPRPRESGEGGKSGECGVGFGGLFLFVHFWPCESC